MGCTTFADVLESLNDAALLFIELVADDSTSINQNEQLQRRTLHELHPLNNRGYRA